MQIFHEEQLRPQLDTRKSSLRLYFTFIMLFKQEGFKHANFQ
jgi:hypothetical protein